MRTRRRYPVVAMRAQVVLPGGVARFDLSRSRTVAAVEEAMVRDGLIFLVAQKNPEELDPGVGGTYRYGTLCQIRSLTRTSRDTRRAMLFGIRRCSVEQLILEGDIYEAELYNAPLREIEKDSKEKEAMLRALKGYLQLYAREDKAFAEKYLPRLISQTGLMQLLRDSSSQLPWAWGTGQRLLECNTGDEFYEVLTGELSREIDVVRMRHEYEQKLRVRLDRSQREFMLREQLRIIEEELGEDAGTAGDVKAYAEKIDALPAGDEVKQALRRETLRLRHLPQGTQEFALQQNYLDTVLALPFDRVTEDTANLAAAKRVLERDHYGLENVKEKILNCLAVRKLNPTASQDVLCLVGPPGTGKTLLAKAVAGEANVPFFSLSGSDFVEMYVGVGASRVRDLFRQAQEAAPCIIFIDEIDAIGKSRDSRYGGGNDEREQTLNQLLSEMDGFDSSKGLLVLGATNRPEILDPALLRPGRFDRRVIVERPDLKGRIEILKVHAKDVMLDDTVDFDAIGLATSGAVGSELANMVNEAAILAVKNGRKAVSQKDLFESVEVVLVGKEKKDRVMNQKERRIVSYHEVGHALISALQKNTEPVQKITIVPRTMGALGYVMYVPEEETYLMSKKELEERLVSTLGGRAAEELVFGDVTTGAQNDIEQATNIAKSMVTMYGMSESFGLMGLARVENQYLSGRTVMDCSDQTAAQVDKEVERILKEAYQTALQLLRENRMVLDQIADFLINRETITGKEFMRILRKVKNLPTPLSEQEPILI